jgi:hypothetical protein
VTLKLFSQNGLVRSKLEVSENDSFRGISLIFELILITIVESESINSRDINFVKSKFANMHPIPKKGRNHPSAWIDLSSRDFREKLKILHGPLS